MAAQEASIKIDKEVMKWKAEAVFGRLPKFLDPDQKGSSCSELVVKVRLFSSICFCAV